MQTLQGQRPCQNLLGGIEKQAIVDLIKWSVDKTVKNVEIGGVSRRTEWIDLPN